MTRQKHLTKGYFLVNTFRVRLKDKLTEQYKKLDPIILKSKLVELQEKLWKHAWTKEIKTADEKNAIVEDNICTNTNPKLYRKADKIRRPHDWKTRTHPLDSVMDFIKLGLELASNLEAKVILDKLMEKYPNEFCKSYLRTLQRRVSELRDKESQREKNMKN